MKIFLSTPISTFRNAKELRRYKRDVSQFIASLNESNTVCAEIERISSDYDYDMPEESIKRDFVAIKECDVFILHYPIEISTSALIELGYALANNKQIIIITPSKSILPYLALGIEALNQKSVIIENGCLSDSTEEVIKLINEK